MVFLEKSCVMKVRNLKIKKKERNREFCDLFKIETHFTTNYNSNSNSLVELLEKLRTIKSQQKNETPQNIISAVLTYN